MITVVALIIAIIVAGEIDHLNHLLGRAQDLPPEGAAVGIKGFSVLRPRKAGWSGWPTAGGA